MFKSILNPVVIFYYWVVKPRLCIRTLWWTL